MNAQAGIHDSHACYTRPQTLVQGLIPIEDDPTKPTTQHWQNLQKVQQHLEKLEVEGNKKYDQLGKAIASPIQQRLLTEMEDVSPM